MRAAYMCDNYIADNVQCVESVEKHPPDIQPCGLPRNSAHSKTNKLTSKPGLSLFLDHLDLPAI